ncbi:MAG: hypothetical protein E7356_01020 [Clostridiales bacterium]|nr:hypothetical protein [Clostridiales bacterium]
MKESNQRNSESDKVKTNQEMEKMIDQYSALSENELMQEFIKKTVEQKRNGRLNSEELNNIKSKISPMLNDEQNKKLNELIMMVNGVE